MVGRNPDEDNSAVEAYYQAEADVDGKERVLSELAELLLPMLLAPTEMLDARAWGSNLQ